MPLTTIDISLKYWVSLQSSLPLSFDSFTEPFLSSAFRFLFALLMRWSPMNKCFDDDHDGNDYSDRRAVRYSANKGFAHFKSFTNL
jgi:hypothetical protein